MAAKYRDQVLTRERVLVAVLVAVTAMVLWLCWLMTEPFVPALTWALTLAVIAHPWHERILARMPNWPNLAAIIAVVTVNIAIAIPALLMAREVVNEAIAGADALQRLGDADRWKRLFDPFPRQAPLRDWIGSNVNMKPSGGSSVASVQAVLGGVSEFAMTTLITFFLLYFFLRDKWKILQTLQSIVPLAPGETAQVEHKMRDMIGAVVYGTLTVAFVQGILGGGMFWALGLPAPLLWGAVMALVAVLPLFGAALVWVPAALFLLADGHWEKALILTLWGGIVIGLIDNILLPMLMKNKVAMHTVPVFIAAMGGLFAFGATGIVLGPLVLALAISLLDVWRRRMQMREIEMGVNESATAHERSG